MIPITKPYLPSLTQYNQYLKNIWKSNVLTNDGSLVKELEQKLQKYWGVKHVICVSSGTVAIQIALKALDIKKEIYVDPLSFVATVSAPMWMGIKPKFIDIGKKWQGPALITHTYGIPHLKDVKPVIYDASHAFAVQVNGKSIMTYGDISIISFHATKIFHTIEGGAVVTNSDTLAEKARWMRNFGYNGQYNFDGVGINAKMSEFHAAMGLCNLKNIKKILSKYKYLVDRYNKVFGTNYQNVSYYPLLNHPDTSKIVQALNKRKIYPRRYFYPALNTIFSDQQCPLAEAVAELNLCLPLYYDLTTKQQDLIIKIVQEAIK